MKGLLEYVIIFLVVTLVVYGADATGDRGYVLRLVQNGVHESIYLLIGTALGLVMRDSSSRDGLMALIAAVAAVISSMLLGAFDNLEHQFAWFMGTLLVSVFLTSLLASIFSLFKALSESRELGKTVTKAERPRFVRTPPPRYRR